MFIWDFVAAKVLGQIVDWFYSQIVGFLGNFFSEMGNMGAELFTMDWVQSIVLFFSYLAWALYGTGLVVACFETGVEYSSGRGNIRETALNAIKGFMAVSLFTVVPVRLYELCVSLQGTFTAALTGYGTSIGDVAGEVMQEFNAVESISDLTAGPLLGFGSITSGIMILFCLSGAFSLAWRCLDAQFWGVAQRRKRIFLLADFAGPLAPQLLFDVFGETENCGKEVT